MKQTVLKRALSFFCVLCLILQGSADTIVSALQAEDLRGTQSVSQRTKALAAPSGGSGGVSLMSVPSGDGWNESTIDARAINSGSENILYWKITDGCLYVHCDADFKEGKRDKGADYASATDSYNTPWKSAAALITSAVVTGDGLSNLASVSIDCPPGEIHRVRGISGHGERCPELRPVGFFRLPGAGDDQVQGVL